MAPASEAARGYAPIDLEHRLARTASQQARRILEGIENVPYFSVASLWEMAIKVAAGRSGFLGNADMMRSQLLSNGDRELEITAAHVLATQSLPGLHGDPFDRLLRVQATVEQCTLLTVDAKLARYPGAVLQV